MLTGEVHHQRLTSSGLSCSNTCRINPVAAGATGGGDGVDQDVVFGDLRAARVGQAVEAELAMSASDWPKLP